MQAGHLYDLAEALAGVQPENGVSPEQTYSFCVPISAASRRGRNGRKRASGQCHSPDAAAVQSAFCGKHDPVGVFLLLCLFTGTVCTLQTEQICASSYRVLTLALRVLAVPDFCKHAVVTVVQHGFRVSDGFLGSRHQKCPGSHSYSVG